MSINFFIIGPEDGIIPEKHIRSIVERMQIDYRPQTFYINIPMRVYTLEIKSNGIQHRIWHQIEAHQIIVIEGLTYVEYTPTENDNLTPEDYTFPWWFCLYKRILNRNERVMKCTLLNQPICYIPCSLTDEVCLYPVGQPGSTNVYKFQTIQNLIEQFSLPINIKLAQFPGLLKYFSNFFFCKIYFNSVFDTYKDFNGNLRLFGAETQEFAVCASLSSTNICLIPVTTSIKFLVTSIPLTSVEIINRLSRCQMLIQSFDMQIRRILISSPNISSHNSRSKSQSTINDKRSYSIDQQHVKHEDQIPPTEDNHRSGSSIEKRRNAFRKSRAISTVSIQFNTSCRKS